ncbi:MAG: hypothetical protein ACD_7C00197G0001 [uncultured bacterium]|nr:MAG: hypothetical protein ACD_7C00197G0001 [uncultured bacterium]
MMLIGLVMNILKNQDLMSLLDILAHLSGGNH